MIQRVQTLYLLIVSGLMALMLFFPLGRFLMDDHELVLGAFSFGEVIGAQTVVIKNTAIMGGLIALAALLPFVTIFLFKNRVLQVRMCFVELVLLIGVIIFVGYYLYHATATVNGMGAADVAKSYSWVNILPLFALILTWLANRRILKDEALVRSMERIR